MQNKGKAEARPYQFHAVAIRFGGTSLPALKKKTSITLKFNRQEQRCLHNDISSIHFREDLRVLFPFGDKVAQQEDPMVLSIELFHFLTQ